MERTWLITGCSSGLGKGIAKAVLARGDRAALTARDPAALAAFTAAYPGRALALPLDLSHADSIPKVVAETQRAFGSIDVLVNNAGHGYRAAMEESQPHQVAELFAVNFFGPMDLIRAALPGMRERGGGWICNVTSIGGVRGALGNGDYSAAKAALERASEALAQEVAAFGIRVMLVDLGAFRRDCRDMVQKLAAQYPAAQIWVGTITVGKPSQGPWYLDPATLEDRAAYNDVLRQCVAEAGPSVHLADLTPIDGATRPSTAPTPTGRAWSPLPTVGTRPWQGRCLQKAEDSPGRIAAGVSSQFRNQMDKRPAGTRRRAGWLFWGKGCSPVHLPCASG